MFLNSVSDDMPEAIQPASAEAAVANNSSVSVVIVTHNSGHILDECLLSLPPGIEVIVVDNASNDNSVAIAEMHGVKLLALTENAGYGRGCNLGAKAATGAFFLFMNPDVCLEPSAVAMLAAAAKREPRMAALAPRLVGPDGEVFFRDSSILCPPPYNKRGATSLPAEDCSVQMLSGAALFCRRDAFSAIGGFDEQIFLYYEDDDICRRLLDAGWSLGYVHGAIAQHRHGKSTRSRKGAVHFRSFHWAVSKCYVAQKHGIPFNPVIERIKANIRGSLAALRFNFERSERYFGLASGYAAALEAKRPVWSLSRASLPTATAYCTSQPACGLRAERNGHR